MNTKESKISCPTFRKQEPIMESITERVNKATEVKEKAGFARELGKEADVLLSCSDYDGKSQDCKNCRFVMNLRKKTANLIMKAEKLVK